MKFWEAFKVAITALYANKMRSFLTMLGVIIGVASVILLVSIGQGVASQITEDIEGLGTNIVNVVPGKVELGQGGGNRSGMAESKLTLNEVKLIKDRVKSIEGVTPMSEVGVKARYQSETRFTVAAAVSPDFPKVRNFPVAKGYFFKQAQYEGARRVCVLGQTVVEDLFGSINPIGKKITLDNQAFKVIGVMVSKGQFMGTDFDDTIFIPFTAAAQVFEAEKVSYILVKAKEADDIERVEREIERVLLRRLEKDDFTVLAQGEILNVFQTVLGTLTLMLGGIAGISLLVGGIGIMNIMLVSVTERTREIGIRKAVGARTWDILSQFLVESVTLSLMGGGFGVLVGYLGSVGINRFLVASQVTWWSVGLAFIFSSLVGIFFGVYPAYKAAKVDPVIALRYE